MRKIVISDVTLRQGTTRNSTALSFKEKIEIAKQLDKLNLNVIETAPISETSAKTDILFLHTIAPIIKNSIISCPVSCVEGSVTKTYEAIKGARYPRLSVSLPLSPVQMEFICKMKPPLVLDTIKEIVGQASSVCSDVEYIAEDATRSEKPFLYSAVKTAIEAGATTITICDRAGVMLPHEFSNFIKEIYENVPTLKDINLAVSCTNEMFMSTACSVAAIEAGAGEVKTVISGSSQPTLRSVAQVLKIKGDSMGVYSTVNKTELEQTIRKMKSILSDKRYEYSTADNNSQSDKNSLELTSADSIEKVKRAIIDIGYDLSDDDTAKVYELFCNVAEKKKVGTKELDAIVASAALQVTPTYKLISYVINSGNIINATSQVELEKSNAKILGLSVGDGPIDSAFLAIEQIIGTHYELDDFQIQSITRGREAVGEAIVKLRHNGKLYSGKGVSTDIIGASIRAFLAAVNKICYEENL